MGVSPSPVFFLLLTPEPRIIAILSLAPFLHQPMAVSGGFMGIPVVIVPVFAIIVAPVVIVVSIFSRTGLNSQRYNQGSTQKE
jgi:uncharacterized membrane protein